MLGLHLLGALALSPQFLGGSVNFSLVAVVLVVVRATGLQTQMNSDKDTVARFCPYDQMPYLY